MSEKLSKMVGQRNDGTWQVVVLLPLEGDVGRILISTGKTREEAESKWEDEHGANRKIFDIED